MKEKVRTIIYFIVCILTIVGMLYIVTMCDKNSNMIFGILFAICICAYALCAKNISTENALFWIGITCISIGMVCLILGILLSQQIIIFSLPILFASILDMIGGIIIEHI